MKKNRALRNRIITGIVSTVVSVVLFVMGTVFVASLQMTNIHPFVAIAKNWADYGAVFTVLVSQELWFFQGHYLGFDIVFVVILGLTIVGSIITAIALAKKKCKKLIGALIAEIIFGLVLTYEYLVCWSFKFGPTIGGVPYFYGEQMALTQGTIDLFTKGQWWEPIWVIVNLIACTISLVTIIAVAIVAICTRKVCKCCEESKEIEPISVQETSPAVASSEETVAPRKKAVLIVKRYDKLGATGPIVERPCENYPRETIVQKPLTKEEIRACIRDELERNETRRLAEAYRNEKQAEAIAQAVIKVQEKNKGTVEPKKADNIVSESVVETKEEEKVYPTPIIFAMPAPITNDVAKEVKKEDTKPAVETKETAKPASKGLTEDEVKSIIASEVREALKDFVITHETVVERPVEVKVEAEQPIEKEVAAETNTVENETAASSNEEEIVIKVEEPQEINNSKVEEAIINETAPVEETAEEKNAEPVVEETKEETIAVEPEEETVEVEGPKVEETPATEPVVEEKPITENVVEEVPTAVSEPVVSEEASSEEDKKPERIPFSTRVLNADDDIKNAYNELKSLLKSYGLNNRIANGGDTFRLHRVTFCKITIAGKSLKIYLALNPEDYKDSTYPIKDAGSKATYKDTPLVFKVKSKLSVKRAEELIRDCMDKNGLEQISQVEVKDWASGLANVNIDDDSDEFYQSEE